MVSKDTGRNVMRNKNLRKVLEIAVITGLLLSGCGASGKGTYAETAADTAAYDNGAGYAGDDIYSTEAASEEKIEEAGSTGVEVRDTQRKLIKNVNMDVETETFEELLTTVRSKTDRLGGYIEESYTYNGSSYYGNANRNASLTIRIPAEKLDEFLSEVSEVSNVISRNESVSDVTLQYVDLESHKKALLAEQERLLELLEQAETIEDIISLESRLSEVRYQIESMESQLRTMDNQVSYSTVYLTIKEVTNLTPVKEQTVWEKISTGFSGSLHSLGSGIVNFLIALIISLPYLIFFGIIVLAIVGVIWLIIRASRKKEQKKQGKITQEKQRENQHDEPV